MNVKEAERQLNNELPDLSEKERRGQRARSILEDELFKNAVRVARERAMAEFADSALEDDKARLVARLRIEALTDIVSEINSVMIDGEVAERRLNTLRAMLKHAKDRLMRRAA